MSDPLPLTPAPWMFGQSSCRPSELSWIYFHHSSLLEDCKWGGDRVEFFTKEFKVCGYMKV